MASPQLEDGHTRIANELLEHFCSLGISGGEFRLLLFVVRKTYGFQKKIDRISLTQFEKGTTMSRSHVCLGLKSLVLKQVLVKENGGYKLNKNYDSWVVLRKVPPVLRLGTPSTKASTKSSTKASTHKRNKETNTKEITSIATDVAEPVNEFIGFFREINPSYETLYANRTQRAAAERLLKKFGLEPMRKTLLMVQKTNELPYAPVITTPLELEKNGGRLKAFLQKNQRERLKNQIVSI